MIFHRIENKLRRAFGVCQIVKPTEDETIALNNLRDQIPKKLRNQFIKAHKGEVLIEAFARIERIGQHSSIIFALKESGYRIVVLLYAPHKPLMDAYRLLGVDKFDFLSNYTNQEEPVLLEEMTMKARLNGPFGMAYENLPVGTIATSTIMRKLRVGSIDLDRPNDYEHFKEALKDALIYADAACELFQKRSPHLVIMIDRGYSPMAQVFHRALDCNVDVITMNGAHRANMLMFKRYSRHNRYMHPSSLSENTWTQLMNSVEARETSVAVFTEMNECYQNEEWYGEVGTQFNTSIMDVDEVRNILKLRPNCKVACIFPHLFWDATFFWGDDLFDNYQHWFEEVVAVAERIVGVEWIVKVHPANNVKNQRDGYYGELLEESILRNMFQQLPKNLHIISTNDGISTYSLFEVMDYCLTVRGTIGLEAASHGIPTLTAGTGRYDRRGFTIDSDTRNEYLSKLENIEDIPPMTDEQREHATLYAYGIFNLRPTPLKVISMSYRRDETASMEIAFNLNPDVDLKSFYDVKSIRAWIESGKEDYLITSL